MLADGRGAWWNGYEPIPLETTIRRAQQTDFVIVKAGYWAVMQRFLATGLVVGAESYVLPTRPEYEARLLSDAVGRGAAFVVINAEVEWERLPTSSAMDRLLAEFMRLRPGVEIYASVDTRGGRTRLPYQRVLGQHCTAWMPMIYPLTFYPNKPVGRDWVGQAFIDCLESGQDFQGKPVLPTIQTYGGIGAGNVRRQLEDVAQRNLLGCQAYTAGHATRDEWAVFAEWEDDMAPLEEMQEELERQKAEDAVAAMFLKAAACAFEGKPLPSELEAQIKYVMAIAG